MKPRTVVTALLLAFVAASVVVLVVKEAGRPRGEDAAGSAAPLANGVAVYYFHRTQRCESCNRIEAYTGEVVEGGFAADIAARRLVFQAVNMDSPGNEHFVTDYELTSNGVVLVEYKAGEQQRWKNLVEVWNLFGDRPRFLSYVQGEIAAFMGSR